MHPQGVHHICMAAGCTGAESKSRKGFLYRFSPLFSDPLVLKTKAPEGSRRWPGPLWCEQDCKPGSVFDSHLSRRTVAGTLQPPRERPGQPWGRTPCSHTGVAPDRVYSIGQSPADGCALTAPFHPYRQSYSLSVRVAYRSLRERPLRRADFNREEGPFVPLHTTPLRCSARGRLRCSGKFPSPRSAGHRVQPSLFP